MCVSGYMLNLVDPGNFNVTTNTSSMFICDPLEIQAQVRHKSWPPGPPDSHLLGSYNSQAASYARSCYLPERSGY